MSMELKSICELPSMGISLTMSTIRLFRFIIRVDGGRAVMPKSITIPSMRQRPHRARGVYVSDQVAGSTIQNNLCLSNAGQ